MAVTTIGITGKMGSGKSTMAAMLAQCLPMHGRVVETISVDDIRRYIFTVSPAHQALRDKVSAHFGVPTDAEGAVPLDLLSRAVFRKENGPEELKDMIGPEIAALIHDRVNEAEDLVLLEWARLLEDGYLPLVDRVVVMHCDTPALHARLSAGGLPTDIAERRLSLQMSADEAGEKLRQNNVPFFRFDTTDAPVKSAYESFCREVIHG